MIDRAREVVAEALHTSALATQRPEGTCLLCNLGARLKSRAWAACFPTSRDPLQHCTTTPRLQELLCPRLSRWRSGPCSNGGGLPSPGPSSTAWQAGLRCGTPETLVPQHPDVLHLISGESRHVGDLRTCDIARASDNASCRHFVGAQISSQLLEVSLHDSVRPTPMKLFGGNSCGRRVNLPESDPSDGRAMSLVDSGRSGPVEQASPCNPTTGSRVPSTTRSSHPR